MFCCCKDGSADAEAMEVSHIAGPQPDEFKWADNVAPILRDGDLVSRDKSKVLVEFELPSGSLEAVAFTKRPLGLDFFRHLPITVKRAKQGFHAKDDHNIQKHWIVRKVDDEPLTGTSFSTDFERLNQALQRLPETKTAYNKKALTH